MVIAAIERLNQPVLIENSYASGANDEPWVALILAIIALVSVEDDGGAFLNDIHCTSRRDSTCRSERDFRPGDGLEPRVCV